MSGRVFKRSAIDIIRGGLAPMLITLLLTVMIVAGLGQTEASGRAEGLRILEESIQNAVVRCYVVEGSYPAGISHIEERYGVYIDRTRYNVFYEASAPNIMPRIVVVERK